MVITGRKPVLESLKNDASISKIYIQFGNRGDVIEQIKQLAKQNNIPVSEVAPQKLVEIAGRGETQGIAALREEIKLLNLDRVIEKAKQNKNPLLLLLDMIQDPHNLGAILRTAEASGVDGVLITKHNSAPINQTVVKASAGAIEHLNICYIDNLVNALKLLKDNGYWVVGTSLDGDRTHTSVDFKMPTVLVMGNEEKGIRPLTARNCDFLVKIPMAGKINSLNVSVATGVMLFEVLRQKSV